MVIMGLYKEIGYGRESCENEDKILRFYGEIKK